MTARGVALTPMETRRDVVVRAAVLADELGYETFAVPEGWGFDSTPVLTEIAVRTNRIRLVSGVLSVWGRTPATLAMTAATLHQVSEGRYVLGLGASTKALAEGFHDVPFSRPAERLREVVTAVRTLLRGEPAQLRGTRSARPLRLGQPPVPELPIWIAALGPRTMEVATELGDGWIPALVARDRVAGSAAELRGRRESAFTVATGPIAVAAEDPGMAREIAATCLAWYLSAMGDVYARSLAGQGYADEVSAVIAANPRPSPRHGTVPAAADGLLDQLAVHGTPEQIQAQLKPWDDAADIVSIMLPPGLPWDTVEATIRAAAG
ncbi:LLM class flavin-dependent oxidoreductase [Amycolatopsis sp. GM8]|uniref:LLM class flavin-dependent oxidoreductase n=1 Tax=Amycolatopsis sp. GM8 TaxID=2896530 RepID=UPI001F27BAD0|nr:LLM class flavin-dependent oxidoreductase [Amycolatopsis sp. GM8]